MTPRFKSRDFQAVFDAAVRAEIRWRYARGSHVVIYVPGDRPVVLNRTAFDSEMTRQQKRAHLARINGGTSCES